MKIYPTDFKTGKYAFHILLIALIFETLWLLAGQFIPFAFGFVMPPLTYDLWLSTIFSTMTIILFVILWITDVSVHTILQME